MASAVMPGREPFCCSVIWRPCSLLLLLLLLLSVLAPSLTRATERPSLNTSTEGRNLLTTECDLPIWISQYASRDCGLGNGPSLQQDYEHWAQCTLEQLDGVDKEFRVSLPSPKYLTIFQDAFQNFSQDTGTIIKPSIVSSNASFWNYAVSEAGQSAATYNDAYITLAGGLGDLVEGGLAASLEPSVLFSNLSLGWYGISQAIRGIPAHYGGKTYAVPLGGNNLFLYYRGDVFSAAGIPLATLQTWDDLLSVARNYTKISADGPEYAFCFQRQGRCGGVTFLAIMAQYMQTQGAKQGYLVDVDNGRLLLDTTGARKALQVYRELRSYGPAEDDNACSFYNEFFMQGKCLMSVSIYSEAFKVYSLANTSEISRKFAVTQFPGSQIIHSRTRDQLVNCTRSTCPYAFDESGTGRLINRAPFMHGHLVGVANLNNPRHLITRAISVFAAIANPTNSWDLVTRLGTGIAPFRTEHWQSSNAARFINAGYPADLVPQWMAVHAGFSFSLNRAHSLRIRGAFDIMDAIGKALDAMHDGVRAEDETLGYMEHNVQKAVIAVYPGGFVEFVDNMRKYFGSPAPSPRPASPPAPIPGPGREAISSRTVVVITVVSGVAMVLLAVVTLEVRNKRHHKDLLGRVRPPSTGPDTTITVVKVEEFDHLWDALVDEASDKALQIFNQLAKKLLRKHSGYRSPSDEELIIAVFHHPRNAVQFALDLQSQLLTAKWPKQVLDMVQFAPMYMAPVSPDQSGREDDNETGGALKRMQDVATVGLEQSSPQQDEDDVLFFMDSVGSGKQCKNFGEQCTGAWREATAETPGREVVFNGLRVRIALCAVCYSTLYSEVEPAELRVCYHGEPLSIAMQCVDAGQGGMIVIPQQTFRQLHVEYLSESCLFCHYGEYSLREDLPDMDLYIAVDRSLLGRLALFEPLKCRAQLSQGAFAAPVNAAAMAFTHVVGVQTLLAWNYEITQHTLAIFTAAAKDQLKTQSGYLVEHVDGFMLTAFSNPATAISWGLRMQELMLREPWSEELLSHELCEEVIVGTPGEIPGTTAGSIVVFRGPRLKTGIDLGPVLARLHTITGRMTYRGKVMNRAARISSIASSGQVLCSSEAWESALKQNINENHVDATSLGMFQLKGIAERMEVFHCTYVGQLPAVVLEDPQDAEFDGTRPSFTDGASQLLEIVTQFKDDQAGTHGAFTAGGKYLIPPRIATSPPFIGMDLQGGLHEIQEDLREGMTSTHDVSSSLSLHANKRSSWGHVAFGSTIPMGVGLGSRRSSTHSNSSALPSMQQGRERSHSQSCKVATVEMQLCEGPLPPCSSPQQHGAAAVVASSVESTVMDMPCLAPRGAGSDVQHGWPDSSAGPGRVVAGDSGPGLEVQNPLDSPRLPRALRHKGPHA